jgi:hypothetical protein
MQHAVHPVEQWGYAGRQFWRYANKRTLLCTPGAQLVSAPASSWRRFDRRGMRIALI